jgi:predicted pyridoxine 5'-phosphate oxidase superfamily flavin-nucleotide-binding protein
MGEKERFMPANLTTDWPWIVRHVEKSLKTSQFCTFATVNPDGTAQLAPIASLVLNPDCTGYYSAVYAGQMATNLETDQRVCVMAVCMGMGYWLKGLLRGRFDQWPALRLYGRVAPQARPARPGEIERWRKRMKYYKHFKGYDLLWKHVSTVRDIHFDRYDPIRLGSMTRHLGI